MESGPGNWSESWVCPGALCLCPFPLASDFLVPILSCRLHSLAANISCVYDSFWNLLSAYNSRWTHFVTLSCWAHSVSQERHFCQYLLKSSLPLGHIMQQWDVHLQMVCVKTEVPENPLEGSGWQSSHAPSPMLRQPGTAPWTCKSTYISTVYLLVTEELAQPIIKLLRGHLWMTMCRALTIVGPDLAIQWQSCSLSRLFSPLLQMKLYVDTQSLEISGEPKRKKGIPLLICVCGIWEDAFCNIEVCFPVIKWGS